MSSDRGARVPGAELGVHEADGSQGRGGPDHRHVLAPLQLHTGRQPGGGQDTHDHPCHHLSHAHT